MSTAAASKPEVFTRKASGLVRVMSPFSAFIYNVLTMGLIFPWTYLWAPGALPGGKMVWGILLAMVIELPLCMYGYPLHYRDLAVTMCSRVVCLVVELPLPS